MTYIGNTSPSRFSSVPAVQRFSGNNSTTAFTLSTAIGSEQEILVSVDGVIQDTANYTVSGTTLTFSPAPSAGTNNIFVFTLSRAIASVTHPPTSALSATSGTFSGNVSVGGDLDVTGSLDMSDANLTNVGSIQLDSIAGDADTNTTIAFPGSDIITLGTAGSERVRIDASGNVGIGKTPVVPLDVQGQIRSMNGSVDLRMLPVDASNAGIVGTYSDDALVLYTNSAERVRITSAGNVGIGTTSPSAFGGTTFQTNHASTYSANLVSSGSLVLQMIASQTHGAMSIGARSNHHVAFTTNDTERMRITSDGKVGVGATAVDRQLHLEADNSTTYSSSDFDQAYNLLKIENNNTTNNVATGLQFLVGTNGSASITTTRTGDGEASLCFGTRGGGSRAERMRIDASGNVMIGTTSLQQKLTVSGGSVNIEDGYAFSFGDNSYRIEGKDDGGNARIGFVCGGSEVARFNTTGLAIGGTGTANTLDDYEEGTFTPNFIGSGDNYNPTYTFRFGQYTKIGDTVYFTLRCASTSVTSNSDQVYISGLPFAANYGNSGISDGFAVVGNGMKIDFGVGYVYGNMTNTNSVITLLMQGYNVGSGAGIDNFRQHDMYASHDVRISGFYKTTS